MNNAKPNNTARAVPYIEVDLNGQKMVYPVNIAREVRDLIDGALAQLDAGVEKTDATG